MEKTKFFCDRCGAEIGYSGYYVDMFLDKNTVFNNQNYEFCHECSEEFKARLMPKIKTFLSEIQDENLVKK